MRATAGLVLSCVFLALVPTARAWNAHGHRTVTRLALEGLAPDMPSWLRDPGVAARIADQSNEPDRWRGTRRPAIGHELNPEHYLDVEDLEPFGLVLEELPPWRYEYFRAMVRARMEHPERMAPYDGAKDPDKSKEWPGFLPWAMAEHFAKLQSSFNTLRVLEAIDDPQRAAQLAQARENVIYEMGILSHYVGDAAQPLHTTRHHHGWVGENPEGYTRESGFHSYIDGKILEIHRLDLDSLRPLAKFERTLASDDPWPGILAHIRRSFDQVEPLYQLHKAGTLTQEPGRVLISERLCDAGAMLAAMYNAAWKAGAPSDRDVSSFIRYSEMPARREPPKPADPGPGTEMSRPGTGQK